MSLKAAAHGLPTGAGLVIFGDARFGEDSGCGATGCTGRVCLAASFFRLTCLLSNISCTSSSFCTILWALALTKKMQTTNGCQCWTGQVKKGLVLPDSDYSWRSHCAAVNFNPVLAFCPDHSFTDQDMVTQAVFLALLLTK